MKKLFSAVNMVLGVVFSFAVQANSIWFATEDSLQKFDSDTLQVVTTLPLPEVKSLAVNAKDASLLALTEKQILKFSASGLKLWEKSLSDLGLSEGKRLAVNPYDGSVWISSDRKLVRLNAEGRQLISLSTSSNFKRFALALDESLWVLGESRIWHYSPSGALLESRSLSGVLSGEAKRLAVDSLGKRLWIASETQLAQLDVTDLGKSPRIIALDDEAENIVIEPLSGTLWVLGEKKLLGYATNATLIKTIDLVALSVGEVESIAYDSSNKFLWLGHEKGIAKLSPEGNLLAKVTLTGEVEAIGVASFFVTPIVSLIQPPENALTNNPKPSITLGFDAQCLGAPCGFGTSYAGSYSVTANLNDQPIGSLFSFDAITGQSSYTPNSALIEGQNTFNAQVRDGFGHASNRLETTFTLDSIPPQFVSLLPPEGSVVTAPQTIVSGTVDDAQAFIVLDGLGGPVNGPNFSFPVTLSLGTNTLKLTAIDKAGNQSSIDLNLSYATNTVSVAVANPVSGVTISGDTVLVSGEFRGQINTGITVNGVVASISANQFYATVTLQPGVNTITVTATSPDGATASQAVTVTSSGPNPFRAIAEPAEGAAPLKAGFRVESTSGKTVQKIDADFDGNGSVDLTVSDLNAVLEFSYTTPGVYAAKFLITDSQGISYSAQATVVVQDPVALDQQFKAIWDGMNNALIAQNKSLALTYLNQSAQAKYGPVFDVLLPDFPAIIASYSGLQRVTVTSGVGEYAINRMIDGVDQIFFVYFLQGQDGIWRLDSM